MSTESPGSPVIEPEGRDAAPPARLPAYRIEQPGYHEPSDIADEGVALRRGGRAMRKQASAEAPGEK